MNIRGTFRAGKPSDDANRLSISHRFMAGWCVSVMHQLVCEGGVTRARRVCLTGHLGRPSRSASARDGRCLIAATARLVTGPAG